MEDTGDALLTGFGHMQDEYANLNEERSQFKLHYLSGKMLNEKVIRLPNGFPTTKREKDAFEAQQEKNMKILAEKMGIVVPRAKNAEAKVGGVSYCPHPPLPPRLLLLSLTPATAPLPHTCHRRVLTSAGCIFVRLAAMTPARAGALASTKSAAVGMFRWVRVVLRSMPAHENNTVNVLNPGK